MKEEEQHDIVFQALKEEDIDKYHPNQTRLSYMQQIKPQIVAMMKPKILHDNSIYSMALYAWMIQQEQDAFEKMLSAFIVTPEEIKAFQPQKYHRPLINGVLLQRRLIPMLKAKMASFEWAPPINVSYLPEDSRLYKCVLAVEGDWNKQRFDGTNYKWVFTADEINRMARTIIGGYVDHNHTWFDPLDDVMVIDAEGAIGEDGKTRLEAFIFSYGHSTLDYAYDNDQIVGTSIEFLPREENSLGDDRFLEKGNKVFGVAYLTGVTPSSSGTKMELIAIGKPMSKTLNNSYKDKKMEKAEIEAMLKPDKDAIEELKTQMSNIYNKTELDEKLAALTPSITKEEVEGLKTQLGEIQTSLGDLITFKTAVLADKNPDQNDGKPPHVAQQESLSNDQSKDIGQHLQDDKDSDDTKIDPKLKLAQKEQEKEWKKAI